MVERTGKEVASDLHRDSRNICGVLGGCNDLPNGREGAMIQLFVGAMRKGAEPPKAACHVGGNIGA